MFLLSGIISITAQSTSGPSSGASQQSERGIRLGAPAKLPGRSEGPKGEELGQPELIVQTGYGSYSGRAKIAFSPDGRLLAVSRPAGEPVKLWEVATGRELRTLGGTPGADTNSAQPLAFSPDSHFLVVGGSDAVNRVWDVLTGRLVLELPPPADRASFHPIRFVAFKPDGHTLISVNDLVRVWDVLTGREVDSFKPRALARRADKLTFTESGNFALSHEGDQIIEVTSIPGEGVKRQGVAQVNDPAKWGEGEFVGSVRVNLFAASNARESRQWELPGVESYAGVSISAASFTPGGTILVTGVDGQKLKLWDVNAGAAPRILGENVEGPAALFFSPHGRFLVAMTGTTIRLWDTATGRENTIIKLPREGTAAQQQQAIFPAIAISHDERWLASTRGDAALTLWDVPTKSVARRITGTGNPAYSVSFSPDGKYLTSGGRTRWDLSQGVGTRLSDSAEASHLRIPSPDGRKLAGANPADNTISIFDAENGLRMNVLPPPKSAGDIRNLFFDPGSKILAALYGPGTEKTRRQSGQSGPEDDYLKASQEATRTDPRPPAGLLKIYQSRLVKRLAAQAPNYVRLWDAETGKELRTLLCPKGAESARFGGGGQYLITADAPGELSVWEVETGRVLRSLIPAGTEGNDEASTAGTAASATTLSSTISEPLLPGAMIGGPATTSFAVSPDGKILAVGAAPARFYITRPAITRAARVGPAQKNQNVVSGEFSNFGRSLPARADGRITLWDLATGESIGEIHGHGAPAGQLAFSADAKWLASSAADHTIIIWDVATRREVIKLMGHRSSINSLAFSPDARLIASASDDGSTYLWDVEKGEHLTTLVSLFDGGEWLVVAPDGLFDGTPASLNQILWRYDQDTFNVAPVEWFFNEFYQPGLLAEMIAGKRPKAAQSFALKERRQPRVTLSLGGGGREEPARKLAERTVTVTLQVSEEPPAANAARGSGAQDLRLFRNGSLVKSWRGDLLGGGRPDAVFETTLPLVAGENSLVAYAFNRDNVKSLDAKLSVIGDESLRRPGVAYVLGIGVNEYENPQYNLRFAVPDARTFTDEVARQQNRLRLYERMETILLYDKEATKENILRALSVLAAKAQPEDGVAIYFAGHGTAQGKQFYLIPHDLGHAGERSKLDEAGLQTLLAHSISDRELEQAFEKINSGRLLLVLDTCNSGQVLETDEQRRGPMNSKGLAQLAYEKGMYVLAASESFQAAQEVEQLGHGLLTYALVEEGLKQRAADFKPRDGSINIREWFDYATSRVPEMQVEKMKQGRASNVNLSTAEDGRGILRLFRNRQRPRSFYRRELEAHPFIIARQ